MTGHGRVYVVSCFDTATVLAAAAETTEQPLYKTQFKVVIII